MKRWLEGTAGAVVLCTLAGCGGVHKASTPPPTTKHYAQVAMTVTWQHALHASKPVTATLTIRPATAQVLHSTLNMTAMQMPPLSVHWLEAKPGTFRTTIVPPMSGSWALSVTFAQGGRKWQESYPVTVWAKHWP